MLYHTIQKYYTPSLSILTGCVSNIAKQQCVDNKDSVPSSQKAHCTSVNV